MKLALSQFARSALEPLLPDDVEAMWFSNTQEAIAAVPGAEVALLDVFEPGNDPRAAIEAGRELKWIMTSMAGIGNFPLDLIAERKLILTNGAGINAAAVAEWTVMGILALAKGLHQVIVHHERADWPRQALGTTQVAGSKVMIIGYGNIGRETGARLQGLGAHVLGVRRNPDRGPNEIGFEDWRPLLPDFDFIVLAAPATPETYHLIGARELHAMKESAGLVNIARGSLVDQDALVQAVRSGSIGGAFLDVTDPEPLPQDHPLWKTPGITVTGHLAGQSQTSMAQRTADLFIENLERYRTGQSLLNQVDPALGY